MCNFKTEAFSVDIILYFLISKFFSVSELVYEEIVNFKVNPNVLAEQTSKFESRDAAAS